MYSTVIYNYYFGTLIPSSVSHVFSTRTDYPLWPGVFVRLGLLCYSGSDLPWEASPEELHHRHSQGNTGEMLRLTLCSKYCESGVLTLVCVTGRFFCRARRTVGHDRLPLCRNPHIGVKVPYGAKVRNAWLVYCLIHPLVCAYFFLLTVFFEIHEKVGA